MAIAAEGKLFERNSIHPQISLDALFKVGLDHVDFIKMDTQGSEPLIIKGGMELIKKNSKHLTMIMEFVPIWLDKILGIKPLDFFNHVCSLGFRPFYIHPIRHELLPVENPQELIANVEAADGKAWKNQENFVDLVLRPR